MSFYDQLGKVKRVRDMMVKEAPRGVQGELLAPFCSWVLRLDNDIAKAERWHRDTEARKVRTGTGPDPTR